MLLSDGSTVMFPGVFRRIKDNLPIFLKTISRDSPQIPSATLPPASSALLHSIQTWADTVSQTSRIEYSISMDALRTFFAGQGYPF